jgi:ComF family protein
VCGAPLPDGGARCFECRRRRRVFRFCRSLGLYEGRLRQAILALKYGGRDALAAPLGLCLARAFSDRPEFRRTDALVPIPLHFLKRHGRGYNQAELLARSLGDALGLPVWEDVLKRRRWTWAQAKLNKERRKANVKDAFLASAPDQVKGKRLLLIDDVCTTGATLEAAAEALKAAGARSVSAFTLARDC